ncbi:MAG: nucleoside deaminase [Bacteroidetes bacterium]|nr:nucleoside deaminase [Bacteroidota bacterium]
MELDLDVLYMKKALEQAQMAYDADEVPIGAIVVCNSKIIGKGFNQTERLNDVTAHAEMLAITAAASHLGGKYLDECTLYVTIEPCVMCAGAIKHARFQRVVIGATEPKTGFSQYLNQDFNTKTELKMGVLEEDCRMIMKQFFKEKRASRI